MLHPPIRRAGALLALLGAALTTSCATRTPTAPDSQPIDSPIAQSVAPNRIGTHAARDLTPTASTPSDVLLRGATLITVTGDTLPKGDLLLQGGTITRVSPTPIPDDALPEGITILDATGRFISPGIIDTHSHLGVYPSPGLQAHSDGNEATSPTTADVDAAHSVWPQDPGFQRALAGGVTALQILPGSANLIGGRTATLQLHPGISAEAMRFPNAPVGIKMACGENPKRVYGSRNQKPSTRMGNMAVWRATFHKAQETQQSWDRHDEAMKAWANKSDDRPGERPKPPSRDLGAETLAAAMRGDILVHVHCYRADEMVQVIQLSEEFGFSIRSFHHAVEAYKIRDILAARDISVSTWADWWGFKMEAHDAIMQNAALIHEAGGRAIIHSDSERDIQRLNQEAAKALYAAQHVGMNLTEEDAMRWITINAAWALGIDAQTGSLTEGKRADVVVWSHHPLSVYARAELVFVEGVLEFDRATNPAPWSDFEVGATPAPLPVAIPAEDAP